MTVELPIGGLPLRWPDAMPPARSVIVDWTEHARQVWWLHNARSALNALWEATRPRCVWLPAYVCTAVADAVPTSCQTRYFPLDSQLQPRVDYIAERVEAGDHVLAVNYWGRAPLSEFIAHAKARPDVGWVEDRAHTLASTEPAWGDWIVFSPRKLLGTPDGGVLVSRTTHLQQPVLTPLADFEFLRPSLERFEDVSESNNASWYASYQRAEAAMRVTKDAISRTTLGVLRASDVNSDAAVRRENYMTLLGRLRDYAFIQDASPMFAPLGFPICARSGEKLTSWLAQRRIFAARHWPALPSDPDEFASEHQLAARLVTLPCDYRYGARDMHRVADAVLNAIEDGA